MRRVAAAVNEETPNLRRMKARKENHGHNPSKAILELMDYTIFITTIESHPEGMPGMPHVRPLPGCSAKPASILQ